MEKGLLRIMTLTAAIGCGSLLTPAVAQTPDTENLLIATETTSIDARRHIEHVRTAASAPSDPRRAESRATASLPCVGSPKVPVILVQFSDLEFLKEGDVQPGEEADALVNERYHKFCNGTGVEGQMYRPSGGSWGSVSDYFIAQSDSLFRPQFTVIGPITLPKSYAYYGADSERGYDTNIKALYSEACKMAAASGDVHWSDFDNNGDGTVDFVFFIYAGRGQNESAESDAIWPKESILPMTVTVDEETSVNFGAYGCTCELYKTWMDGIGVMCHELSHGMGLPDFYGIGGSNYGMDYWDVMAHGCYQIVGKQPCEYSAYERDFMGWRELKLVPRNEAVTLTLRPIEDGGYGYIVANNADETGNEYFILENRQNIGFDSFLGCPSGDVYSQYGRCHGLLITHVDYSPEAWTNNQVNTDADHQRFTIVPADGTRLSFADGYTEEYYLSFRGDIYPGSQQVSEMSSYDVYNDKFRRTISHITENEDGTITLTISAPRPQRADVNGDGVVDISDVTALVNLILSK